MTETRIGGFGLAGILALAVAAPAFAAAPDPVEFPEALRGLWRVGDGLCDRERAAPIEAPVLIGADAMAFYEHACQLTRIAPADGGGTALHLACDGEGQHWTEVAYYLPERDRLAFARGSGLVIATRCD